jgi:hypothetical protein
MIFARDRHLSKRLPGGNMTPRSPNGFNPSFDPQIPSRLTACGAELIPVATRRLEL